MTWRDDLETPLDEQPLFYVEPKDRDPASEYQRQRGIVKACRSRGLFVVAIPQAGKRSDWERLQRQREGAVAGVPDLYIAWSGGAYWAEIKDGKGNPTPAQVSVMNTLHRMGHATGVHRGWHSLAVKLREAGAPMMDSRDAA